MRCAICGKTIAESDMVWISGTGTCYPCHQRRVAKGPKQLAYVALIFLLILVSFVGGMIWFFSETTRR